MLKIHLVALLLALSTFASLAFAQTKLPQELNGLRSLNSDKAATIRFQNTTNQTVQIYWLDFDGKRVLYETLLAGETYKQETYLTHPWLITDAKGNGWSIHQPQALVKNRVQKITIAAPATVATTAPTKQAVTPLK